MSEEINALSEAIQLNKEELVNEFLDRLGYQEVDQALFDDLVTIIGKQDTKRFKYIKALEGQEVVDHYLKHRLV